MPSDNENVDRPLSSKLQSHKIECRDLKYAYDGDSIALNLPNLQIQPGEKVYIRSYRKTWGKKRLTDIPQRKILASGPKTKPTTFISIDHQQKVLITESDVIALSDFYSIAPLSGSTMALKSAKNGFVGGFYGGFAATFFIVLANGAVVPDDFPEMVLLSSLLGAFTAIYGGIFGFVFGLFSPDITEEFIIGPDEWSIVEK